MRVWQGSQRLGPPCGLASHCRRIGRPGGPSRAAAKSDLPTCRRLGREAWEAVVRPWIPRRRSPQASGPLPARCTGLQHRVRVDNPHPADSERVRPNAARLQARLRYGFRVMESKQGGPIRQTAKPRACGQPATRVASAHRRDRVVFQADNPVALRVWRAAPSSTRTSRQTANPCTGATRVGNL